jgi:predicted metalloprotease with PDZ domain
MIRGASHSAQSATGCRDSMPSIFENIEQSASASNRQQANARIAAPVVYTITIADPDTHFADLTIDLPTDRQAWVDLVMARWSPGFYRIEEYAAQVQALTAQTTEGVSLIVEQPAPHRWRIHTNTAPQIRVSYRLVCTGTTVTTNWIGAEFAILNGPATFLRLAGEVRRPYEVTIVLPMVWSEVWTGLVQISHAQPNQYSYFAEDFDTLVDAPIMIGTPSVYPFEVDGRQHALVTIGDQADWDGQQAASDLAHVVRAHGRFWNGLPYERYLFLIVFREGGGGLEHGNSTLITAAPSRMRTSEGYPAWLSLATHEFFHAFNVKRLRPVELGPFDYEDPPQIVSLWIAEGLTCYYTDLLLCRAGLRSPAWLLESLSKTIAQLQAAPGRLVQTLEQSSYEVWNNSLSGINPADTTVSYYTKGHVVGFLLDAHIRRMTDGAWSLDDVMRLAYARHGAARGYTPNQFQATAEEVAGTSLDGWFARAIASTAELDYAEALAWFGLRFAAANSPEATMAWILEVQNESDQRHAQRRRAWYTDDNSNR